MEKLLKLLNEQGGKIVSTSSLNAELIAFAKFEKRIVIKRDGSGFVWIPKEQESMLPGLQQFINSEVGEKKSPEIIRRSPGFAVEDLPELFAYYPPKGDQAERYGKISKAAEEFARVVLENTPGCADQTVAIRKIIDCWLSANMTIAVNEKW